MTPDASPFHNDETRQVANAFGIEASSRSQSPAWLVHLDDIKSLEKATRSATSSHAESMASKAKELALLVGVDEQASERLRVALLWHDVGKTQVPDGILLAARKITGEERAIINRHAAYGADLIDSVPGVPPIFAEVARLHHERYDGRGYEGIVGEDIPYLARISQIADVYDAIVEKRPYRPRDIPPVEALVSMITPSEPGYVAHDPYLLRRFVGHVLETVLVDEPAENVASLHAFVASDPMSDLRHLGAEAGVHIKSDGMRTVFSVSASGRPEVVRRIDASGCSFDPDMSDRIPVSDVTTVSLEVR